MDQQYVELAVDANGSESFRAGQGEAGRNPFAARNETFPPG